MMGNSSPRTTAFVTAAFTERRFFEDEQTAREWIDAEAQRIRTNDPNQGIMV
jgi:hypothetical protein